MIKGTGKRYSKYLKHLGVSTIVIGSAFTGYTFTGYAQSADDVEAETTVDVVEASDAEQLPEQRGGRGGRPPGEGDGGHDHHDQTLSDDAYDPSELVTVEPEVEVTATGTTDTELSDTAEEAESTETPAVIAEGQVYYDGQYTGDAISADRWGDMQVVVVIEDGEIENVLIADYPRSTAHSDVISRNALPTLITESITSQDAEIDIVSGATDTSVAFIESLETALEDALIVTDAESASS